MATNFEHYKDEILKVTSEGHDFSVVNGKVIGCGRCESCLFHPKRSGCAGCTEAKMRWLYSEHIEQPKLTKKERLFCELVETGWIARDRTKSVFWYPIKPTKIITVWALKNDNSRMAKINTFSGIQFPFITWEDTDPWAVEDLLKLEVEE